MKRYLCMTSYLWLLLALPLVADTARIYVTNRGGTTIDVIDPATNKVVEVVRGIEAPQAAKFSPDGSRLYITSYGEYEDTLLVLDRKTGKHIKKVPLSGHGDDLVITPDGKLALVAIGTMTGSRTVGALDIIDTTLLEKVKTIPVDRGLHDVAVTPDGKYAAAGSSNRLAGETLIVFDLQTKQPVWEVTFGRGVQPLAIESNPDGSGRRIFVNLYGLHGFAVVDFEKRQEVARILLPEEPGGFGEDTPSHGIAVAPDGKTLWVNSNRMNSVFAYSLPELKLLGRVRLPEVKLPGGKTKGASPNWLTFTPDGKTVYVSNSAQKSVSAIDAKSLKEVARIPVGEVPRRVSTLVLP